MAAVQTGGERALNKVAIVSVLVVTIIFLAPIYWITSTAFKPRNLATTIPPTVMFEPTLTPFAKLFTKRSQLRQPVEEDFGFHTNGRNDRLFRATEACARPGGRECARHGQLW